MEKKPEFTRPPFEEASKVWQRLLSERGLPSEVIWIFDENLTIERDAASPGGGFRVGFQTVVTPPPPEALQVAYEQFSEVPAPMVLYRIGSSQGKSVCLLLCDEWFRNKSEAEGFVKRSEWMMLFRPGPAQEIEEIRDRKRWENRLLRERPIPELNFGMTLRSVHEVLAHGRVLTAYEHYALRFLHVWRHWLGNEG